MIKQFHVKNYKALRDVTLPLKPIHVLIGPNDSGKTSILEAIAALCRSVDFPLNQILPSVPKAPDLLWDTHGDMVAAFTANIDDSVVVGEYGVACVMGQGAVAVARDGEFWQYQDGQRLHISQVGAHVTTVYSAYRTNLPPANVALAKKLHDALSGVAFFRWNPRMLKLPVVLDSSHRLSMDSSGFGLAQCLDDILGLDRDRFRKLETKFCEIFPEIKSVQLVSERAYLWPQANQADDLPHATEASGKSIYFQLQNGKSIRAAQASDGLLLVLAYLTLLHLPDPPRVILVEEPENGIHPKRLGEIINILRQLIEGQNRTQILMTTHSPYLLDLFKPEEVTLCKKEPDGSVSVHPLGLLPDVKKQLEVFNLGEIWTAEGDEALAKSVVDGEK